MIIFMSFLTKYEILLKKKEVYYMHQNVKKN